MTSFTKALYRRDPAAAEAFHKAQQFEHKLQYGKHTQLASFGLRPDPEDAAAYACSKLCGHPACRHGCTHPVHGNR